MSLQYVYGLLTVAVRRLKRPRNPLFEVLLDRPPDFNSCMPDQSRFNTLQSVKVVTKWQDGILPVSDEISERSRMPRTVPTVSSGDTILNSLPAFGGCAHAAMSRAVRGPGLRENDPVRRLEKASGGIIEQKERIPCPSSRRN